MFSKKYYVDQHKNNDPYGYYVYAWIRNKDSIYGKIGTPYYIGKGIGQRAWVKHKDHIPPSDSKFIIILESNLSNIGAYALERRMILWHGRKINHDGILINHQTGGPQRKVTVDRLNFIGPPEPKKCKHCDTNHRRESKFCSDLCAFLSRNNKRIGTDYFCPVYFTHCLTCNKSLTTRIETQEYCSTRCTANRKYEPGERSRKDEHTFKNIKTDEIFVGTIFNFSKYSSLTPQDINHLLNNPKIRYTKDWTLLLKDGSYKIERARKKYLQKEGTCIHCKVTTIVGNISRWHNDNCKLFTSLI